MKLERKHFIPFYGLNTYIDDFSSLPEASKEEAHKLEVLIAYHSGWVVAIIFVTAILANIFG